MASVIVGENESLDSALRRFKRKVISEGVMNELKKREYYVSKGQKKREKKKASIRKHVINDMKNKRNVY